MITTTTTKIEKQQKRKHREMHCLFCLSAFLPFCLSAFSAFSAFLPFWNEHGEGAPREWFSCLFGMSGLLWGPANGSLEGRGSMRTAGEGVPWGPHPAVPCLPVPDLATLFFGISSIFCFL